MTGALVLLRGVMQHARARTLSRAEILRVTWDAVAGSAALVAGAVGFVGAAMCWQAAWQARRVMGDQSFIGPEFLVIMTNEFTPLMVGVMLAARNGGAIASSLATRVVSGQVDALRLQGDDPVRLWAAPQVLGTWLAAMVLAGPALVVGELAGVITMYLAWDVEPRTFVAFGALRAGDVVFALVKSGAFGVAVTVLGARAGLSASSGAASVGAAAMRGVVDGCVAVLVLDALLDAWRFAMGWP